MIEWHDEHFEYELTTTEYKATVFVNLGIYLTKNDQKIHSISLEKEAKQISRHKTVITPIKRNLGDIKFPRDYDKINSYPTNINKKEVLEKAIQKTTQETTTQLLKFLDK